MIERSENFSLLLKALDKFRFRNSLPDDFDCYLPLVSIILAFGKKNRPHAAAAEFADNAIFSEDPSGIILLTDFDLQVDGMLFEKIVRFVISGQQRINLTPQLFVRSAGFDHELSSPRLGLF